MHLFYEVEQEEPVGDDPIAGRDHTLIFKQKRGTARGGRVTLDLTIPSHTAVMASASDHGVQRLFTNLLKRHAEADSGLITLGGIDLLDLNVQSLRQSIQVIDRDTFIGATIREYLGLAIERGQSNLMIQALETVGLSSVIASLQDGLDTEIAPTGWPLSSAEIMQLKLAYVLIVKPKILIMNQLFDLVSEEPLAKAIAELRTTSETTIIYFTNRQTDLGFDSFVHFEADKQTTFDNHETFCKSVHGIMPRQMIPSILVNNLPEGSLPADKE